MRLASLLTVTSLALAVPGCTLVGASAGAVVAKIGPSTTHASEGDHVTIGALLGLLADAIVVSIWIRPVLAPLHDLPRD